MCYRSVQSNGKSNFRTAVKRRFASSRLLIEECAGVELLRRDNCHNVLQKRAVKWQIELQDGSQASICKFQAVDRGMRQCRAFEKRQLPQCATEACSQMAN